MTTMFGQVFVDAETAETILEGLGEVYGSTTDFDDAEPLGAPKLVRQASRSVKRGAKQVSRTAKQAGKLAVEGAMLPYKLQLMLATKIALPLAREICKLPPPLLNTASIAAGVDPSKIPLFCTLVKARRFNDLKRMMPEILKVAIKVSAMATVPGLGPTLAIAKSIPGIQKYVAFADALGTSVRPVDPIELLDAAPVVQLLDATTSLSDEELADGLGAPITTQQAGTAALLVASMAAVGVGLWGAVRTPKPKLPVLV